MDFQHCSPLTLVLYCDTAVYPSLDFIFPLLRLLTSHSSCVLYFDTAVYPSLDIFPLVRLLTSCSPDITFTFSMFSIRVSQSQGGVQRVCYEIYSLFSSGFKPYYW